jgi:RNA polymerase primary sigma factor
VTVTCAQIAGSLPDRLHHSIIGNLAMDAEAALPAPVESSEVVPVLRPAPGMDISEYAPGLVVLETATWYATELRRLPRLTAEEERAHPLAVVAAAADLRQAAVQLDAIQAAALGAFEPFIHEGRPPRRCLIVEEHVPEPLGRRLRDLHAQVGCRRRPATLAPTTVAELVPVFAALPFSPEWLLERVHPLRSSSTPAARDAQIAAERFIHDRDALARANLRLVRAVARRARAPHVPLEDCIQEGNLALLRAVERFDPSRGVRFSSYAVPVLTRAIRALVRRTPPAPLPIRVTRVVTALILPPPGPSRTRSAADLQPPAVKRRWRRRPVELSTDAELDPEAAPLRNWLVDPEVPGPDEVACLEIDGLKARRLLRHLPGELRDVLILRHGLDGEAPRLLRDVATRMGRNHEAVRQMEFEALALLRRALNHALP